MASIKIPVHAVSGWSSPLILNLALDGGKRAGWHSCRFTRGASVPVTHCIDGWVSPSAVLDALVRYRIATHDLSTRIVVTIPTTLSRVPRWLVVEVNTIYIQTYHAVGISTHYHVKCIDKLQDSTSHHMAPGRLCTDNSVGVLHNCMFLVSWDCFKYSRTPFIRINWDGEEFGNADYPDNWIFLCRGYTVSLNFGCYCFRYLQYVPASKAFNHAWFEVLESITLYCTW